MATPSGIPVLDELRPGTHVGQFYWDQHDLLDTLVPYFTTGLRQLERCIWVCSYPLCAVDARLALGTVVTDLAEREDDGQIEIVDHTEWYMRHGQLTSEQIIARWLDAETQALRAGYRGLRVSGNMFWLESAQWDEFAEYEARVHAAFRGRKIVAVCSYPLSKCESHHVVDVLQNHAVSLVRRGGGWDVVHGATAALATLGDDRTRGSLERAHSVEFYREEFPAGRVADRLAAALQRGAGAAALVSQPHRVALQHDLMKRGVDVRAATARRQLVFIDADGVFEAAWARPGLYTEVIEQTVRDPLLDIIERYGAVVAFGELVNLFAAAADREGALAVERWWNEQLAKHPIELACGYSLDSFAGADSIQQFRQVCDLHHEVGVDRAGNASETERLRAELAQVTTALAQEMARRQVIEAAYITAGSAREHLVLLNRLTAALGEVTTHAQFIEIVRDLVTTALDAPGIAVIEQEHDGSQATLVCEGLAADVLAAVSSIRTTRALWSADASKLGGLPSELQTFALVPIRVGVRRLATLVLGFDERREFTAAYRALAEDVARQLALALDRAMSYERLEQERERAETASRAKDEFLAMLGHELRNPLSPILTATQLMRLRNEEMFDKERTVIERQVRHMIRLVDDLLDVSRVTRGKVDLRRRPIEVSEVVAQAVELASPALEERAHRLNLDVPSSGMVVHVDPHRLAQVVSNLLTNAAKYTPRGGSIHVAATCVDGTVSLLVRDTGIGIDHKLLPHVFDLFVQGRQGIDRASGGLGLGLAIAKTIVELHGGKIRARSDGQGRGSEFTVELPRYANTRSVRHSHSGAFVLAALRPYRVLVVDDNEDAALLFAEALRKLGHSVDVAHDGPSALSVARSRPPEIAFLDIGLPVMDGYELGRRLKELTSNPPRLVAVTGYGHTSDRARTREAGFDLHLVKPVDLAAIQDALAKLT